ncbi:transcription factor btd isoform X1 [Drosophila bipectinata]|uniref:transcription factor btd isoform X1 n=1 Tax=Drosophila bipectinata TaxID=42026 RepID=UPI0038B2663D
MLCHLILWQLMMMLPHLLLANPVSSPEISSKGSKSPNSVQHQQVQQQQVQQQQQQQVQQQQQQQQLQLQQQEAVHLNSLSAYASGYDMTQASAQNQMGGEGAFKPSYKMPEMETNFTPMQTAGTPSVASLPSTPMLMQYLPAQTLQDGTGNTVQYLQLIPTRPIIVPISPYLSGGGSPTLAAGGQPDFSGRTATVLSALPPNYGALQGYAAAGALNPQAAVAAGAFRGYRINREAKDKHFPPAFSLNLNEYIPASSMGHEASGSSASHLYLRARS